MSDILHVFMTLDSQALVLYVMLNFTAMLFYNSSKTGKVTDQTREKKNF